MQNWYNGKMKSTLLVVRLSSKGKSSLEIAKKLIRDHHTIKKFLTEGKVTHAKQKYTKPKALSPRD